MTVTADNLTDEQAWDVGSRDAARATAHVIDCDCTECCLIRVESVRAINARREGIKP